MGNWINLSVKEINKQIKIRINALNLTLISHQMTGQIFKLFHIKYQKPLQSEWQEKKEIE